MLANGLIHNRDCLRLLVAAALTVTLTLPAISPFAVEVQPPTNSPLSDPAAAWAALEQLQATLLPPTEWRTKPPDASEIARFQKQVRAAARDMTASARDFIQRFPTHENVSDARIMVVHALSHTVAAADSGAEREIQQYVDATLQDKTIPEDDRVGVFLYGGNVPVMKQAGMRLFTEGMSKFSDEMDQAAKIRMREAMKKFPGSAMPYQFLVALAQRSNREEQKQIATEIISAEGAPANAKALAQHFLAGTKPYEIGKPVEVRFTALDGREVDLAKLGGKVVLIDFWSTTCGPCIGEMPQIKAAYDKFHGRGFEVIGISLDDKENALRRFLKERNLPWPQHFDGKGWGNQFAMRFGIFGIPTEWLVDKRGNLRVDDARGDLGEAVERLLQEKP